MRKFCVIAGCVALCGPVSCAAAPKPDLTLVTSSPLPSMQKYNDYVGKDYWLFHFLALCEGPSSLHCAVLLQSGSNLKVDGLVTNHVEVGGKSSGDPFFRVVLDDGRSGFVDALLLTTTTTTTDPALAAAECKKKGDPKLGMNAAQVAATCWGRPQYVNTKMRKNGKYEQYVYGDNKFVSLRNGIVTSVSMKGRSPHADQFKH
jgi:hypothetical protein